MMNHLKRKYDVVESQSRATPMPVTVGLLPPKNLALLQSLIKKKTCVQKAFVNSTAVQIQVQNTGWI
jgi:hypothetical protein